uniref:TIR domain-containing protein n=1 Tax=Arion vulgaris TaxID=1028688 RepID=A0A0B7AZE4_9EUPU
MGTSSSTVCSVKSQGSAIPMATTGSFITKPYLHSEIFESMLGGASLESQTLDDDFINNSQEHIDNDVNSYRVEDTNLKISPLSEEENADDKNETNKQTSNVNLETALKKLALSDHEMQAALKLTKEYPKLTKHMKLSTDCIISFKSPSLNSSISVLQKLEKIFNVSSPNERTIVGDFMSVLKFSSESYIKYVSLLRACDAKHFSDALLDCDNNQKAAILTTLCSIRTLWWNFTDSSVEFGAQLASDVRIIKELIQNLVSLTGADGNKLKDSFTFESAMGSLLNVGKLSSARQTFREMKLVDILANFLVYENQPKVTMLVLMVLALIIDENQTHLLTSHESVFDLMLQLAKRAWMSDNHRYDGFSVEELIQALSGLSRNDKVKKVLVQKGVLDLIPKILDAGSEVEQETSAHLLWELSFDPENRIKIPQDINMMKTVKDLSKQANKKIARSAQGVLLVIGMEKDEDKLKAKKKKKKKKSTLKESKESSGHVMISYNWSDQNKLIEIRDELRKHSYSTWMDIDNISGSTLQAMAEAVEQADVVLICMSEKYKESPNCRSEAEYAFSLQKPIIPLLMQSEYKADGWLGILLGTKIFYNFSGKYPFEKKIVELVKEIGVRGKLKAKVSQDSPDGPIVKVLNIPVGKTPDAHPSTPFNVLDWIEENKLTKFVNLQALSSEHLCFLKKLSLRAPEFYYSFMLDLMSGKKSSEDLTGLMVLTSALENIPR